MNQAQLKFVYIEPLRYQLVGKLHIVLLTFCCKWFLKLACHKMNWLLSTNFCDPNYIS
jgi:hypothetical protein